MSLLTCLLAGLIFYSSVSATVIHVNSITGRDSIDCLANNGSTVNVVSCRSFNYVLKEIHGKSDVAMFIDTNVTLNGIKKFSNMQNILIRGTLVNAEVRCSSSENTGIFFANVSNITISNLDFDKCSVHDEYKAALIFISSSSINLRKITIRKSHITGIVFINCNDTITLEGVSFLSNEYSKSNICLSYPLGVIIQMTTHNTRAQFSLRNCHFEDSNRIPCTHSSTNSVICGMGMGLGGALGVYFSGHARENSVAISSCRFIGNRGHWGGGAYVQFKDFTEGNNVSIKGSTFSSNTAENGGGGAYVAFLTNRSLSHQTNRIFFSEVNFYNNSAKYGGGLAMAAEYSDHKYTPGANVMFQGCNWTRNHAVYSPAVDITPYTMSIDSDRTGFMPIPLFSDVSLMGNYIYRKTQKHTSNRVNSGVFSITQCSVYFQGRIVFTQNQYSALHLLSALVYFKTGSNVSFYNNTGYNGGAIGMYSFSTIFVNSDSRFEFVNNTAIEHGGGIYYQTSDQHDFLNSLSCFLQYEGQPASNVKLVFRHNQAGSGGTSVHADSFLPCFSLCNRSSSKADEDQLSTPHLPDLHFLHCIGTFEIQDRQPKKTSFQSLGSNIIYGKEKYFKIIPGARTDVNFTVKDQFNQTIHPLMNLGLDTQLGSTSVVVEPRYSINDNSFTPRGHPNDSAILRFIASGIAASYFNFNITLLECPPGFYLDSNLSCVCSVAENSSSFMYTRALLRCDYSTYQAILTRNHWAGYIPSNSTSHEDLYFSPCVGSLCENGNFSNIYLPSSPHELGEAICTPNNKGIMCGQCKVNTSVFFHSRYFQCIPNHLCHLGLLFYMISEVVPVFVMFAVIVIFDFSFTSGNVVGFIFFAQYFDHLAVSVNHGHAFYYLRMPYQLFYGTLNFNFLSVNSLSFCLWEGFELMDVAAFKYVTVLLSFGLVFGLVAVLRSDRFDAVLKLRSKVTTKRSYLNGMAAFLIISYSTCTKTSLVILKPTRPEGIHGKTIGLYTYNGGLPYLEGKHLLYAIPALMSLAFVTILPPLVLLLYPLSLHLLSLCGLSEHWIVNRTLKLTGINKLKPFIDLFQSCYKDRLRFFAGLYLVYRVAIACLFVFFEDDFKTRVFVEVLLISFLSIHSVVQPYKNHMHNQIDSLVFFNLALNNILSMYSVFLKKEIDKSEYLSSFSLMSLVIVQMALYYLPMLVYLVFAIKWLVKKRREKRNRRGYEMIQN